MLESANGSLDAKSISKVAVAHWLPLVIPLLRQLVTLLSIHKPFILFSLTDNSKEDISYVS